VLATKLGRAAAAAVTGGLIVAVAAAPAGAAISDPASLTISATPGTVTAGQAVTVSGTLTDLVTSTGSPNKSVILYTRKTGASAWTLLDTVTTNASGNYSEVVHPTQNTDFAAVFYGSADLQVAVGGPTSVVVNALPSPTLTLNADHTSVPRFSTITLTTTATPSAAGQTVHLQVLYGTTWSDYDTKVLSAGSSAQFVIQAGGKGTYQVRTFLPAASASVGDAASPTVTLTIT
jgi:hypothetical protein